MPKNFSVRAQLPGSVDLTRRNTQNSLSLEIKDGTAKIGTLIVGIGSIEWWPNSNKVNAHQGNWYNFAEIMEKHLPKKRSSR